MTRIDFLLCAAAASLGAYGVWSNQRHPAALPLSSPYGTYSTRAEAFDGASQLLQRGICARLEPVNDTETELQPC